MLEICNLSKSFNDFKVLDDISFNVEKGERVVIIGPSGSGKSTILRCINRLEVLDSGHIYFKDELITEDNIDYIRKEIGMVFQQFNLFLNYDVIGNIMLGPIKVNNCSKDIAYKQARRLLKKFDLYDKKDNYPNELSGGQKQRVAILRTLAMNPKVVLFDEPTSALDPEMVGEVEDLIENLAINNLTMVIVSHDMKFVKKVATKVIFIDSGKIIEEGDPDTIFNHPKSDRLKEFLSKFKD